MTKYHKSISAGEYDNFASTFTGIITHWLNEALKLGEIKSASQRKEICEFFHEIAGIWLDEYWIEDRNRKSLFPFLAFASKGPVNRLHKNALGDVYLPSHTFSFRFDGSSFVSTYFDELNETLSTSYPYTGWRSKSITELAEELKDENWRVRERAVQVLGELVDEQAFDLLMQALSDPVTHVRQQVMFALARFRDEHERAYKIIMGTLQSNEDSSVRAAAISALGTLGDKRAVPNLISILKEQQQEAYVNNEWSVSFRMRVARALAEINDFAAVEPLISSLDYPDETVRQYIVRALGKLGDKRATEPLIAILQNDHDDLEVKGTTASSLGQLKDKRAVEPLINIIKNSIPKRLLEIEYQHSKPDDFPQSRFSVMDVALPAVLALGDIGDVRAFEPLLEVFQFSMNDGWFWGAALALGKLGDPRAYKPLVEALNNEDAEVRRAAVVGLGYLGMREALPLLQEIAIKDKDYTELGQVCSYALEAIVRIHAGLPKNE